MDTGIDKKMTAFLCSFLVTKWSYGLQRIGHAISHSPIGDILYEDVCWHLHALWRTHDQHQWSCSWWIYLNLSHRDVSCPSKNVETFVINFLILHFAVMNCMRQAIEHAKHIWPLYLPLVIADKLGIYIYIYIYIIFVDKTVLEIKHDELAYILHISYRYLQFCGPLGCKLLSGFIHTYKHLFYVDLPLSIVTSDKCIQSTAMDACLGFLW